MAKSLNDIAKALNLDSSTVSRAMTRPHKVAPETRKKILDYIEQVGFRPNLTARNLRKKCTYTIGIVVNDLCDTVIAKATSIMQDEAAKRGFFPIVLSTEDSRSKERNILEQLFNSNVSGLVIIPSSATADLLSNLPKIPIVELDRSTGSKQFDEYRMDDVAAMQLATDYLQKQGCNNVAVLLGNVLRVSSFANRLAALNQCSSALNYLPYAVTAIKTDELTAQAYALTKSLLFTQHQWLSLDFKAQAIALTKSATSATHEVDAATPASKNTVKLAKPRKATKGAKAPKNRVNKSAQLTQKSNTYVDSQDLAAQLLDLNSFDFAGNNLNFQTSVREGAEPLSVQVALQSRLRFVPNIHLMSLEQVKSSEVKLDAILATNNLLASGVLRACYALGVEPQRDLQIFTFDNPDWLQVLPFKLPTITHPLEQAAYLAINRVLDRVEQKYGGDVEERLICPKLLV